MLRRTLALILLAWLIGFGWFAVAMPQPDTTTKTDAVIVLTGSKGRIERGLAVIDQGLARRMLVSGVHKDVRPREFELSYKVAHARMACCITLGFEAIDTKSNARESARWIARNRFTSVRLVTTDWHMRRAVFELRRMASPGVMVIADAVPSRPSLRVLFLEYHKLIARHVARVWGG